MSAPFVPTAFGRIKIQFCHAESLPKTRVSSVSGIPKRRFASSPVRASGERAVRNSIALQYNPDTLTRSYQVQGVGGDGGGERAQPFRLKGPAIETIKLDAEIDATDQLEFPESHANAVAFGIAPQLAVIEALVNPSVDELLAVAARTAGGTLEILSMISIVAGRLARNIRNASRVTRAKSTS